MADLKSTIPLLPWLSYQWDEVQPGMFSWVDICPANKYRVMLACYNGGGDWVINTEQSPTQSGIQVTGTGGQVKFKFEDFGTFMQERFYGWENTMSGTIWVLQVIWKPLVRTE